MNASFNRGEAQSSAPAPPSARGQVRVSKMLGAATELFLRDGFDQTSMDRIVDRSGGSKATLYSYFPTKAELFRSVVDNIVAASSEPVPFDFGQGAHEALEAFGRARLRVVLSERHQALLRLIVSERERFPDLASTYYERGPKVVRATVAAYLERINGRNGVQIDDVAEAAALFVGMLVHRWSFEHLLLRTPSPSEEEIAERSRRTVKRFLAIYTAPGPN